MSVRVKRGGGDAAVQHRAGATGHGRMGLERNYSTTSSTHDPHQRTQGPIWTHTIPSKPARERLRPVQAPPKRVGLGQMSTGVDQRRCRWRARAMPYVPSHPGPGQHCPRWAPQVRHVPSLLVAVPPRPPHARTRPPHPHSPLACSLAPLPAPPPPTPASPRCRHTPPLPS